MKETIERKDDWSVVITRTEEFTIEDPVQQFIFLQSKIAERRQVFEKAKKLIEEMWPELIKYAKIAWLRLGNVTENWKKKVLHKLDIDSDVEYDEERWDFIFLYEADAETQWFKRKEKKSEKLESEEKATAKEIE